MRPRPIYVVAFLALAGIAAALVHYPNTLGCLITLPDSGEQTAWRRDIRELHLVWDGDAHYYQLAVLGEEGWELTSSMYLPLDIKLRPRYEPE